MAISPTSPGNQQIVSFIQKIADDNCQSQLEGVAIGIVVDGEVFSVVSGWANAESKTPVTESTVFEIGSLSKLFTSQLLAVAVAKREVGLDDPVQATLGNEVTLPTDGKSQITYRSLANHRSSLPRLPDDLIATADMTNPYAHCGQQMLYACLSRMKSVRTIGSRMVYSNFGVGLLGHVLGKLAGGDYRTALKERVLIPWGMLDTETEATAGQAERLAEVYKKKGRATNRWDFTEVTVAAGGVRSTLSDMLKFLRMNVSPEQSGMATELAMMRETSPLPECEVGRSWSLLRWLPPIGFLVLLVIVELSVSGWGWLTQATPSGFGAFLITLVPTLVVSCGWGRVPGAVTLGLVTLLSWGLWGGQLSGQDRLERMLPEVIGSGVILFWGAVLVYSFSKWNTEAFIKMARGEGRLAWQGLELGSHPVLWHNGMTGGSASFLGVVPGRGAGVVVLTNTAKSVDAIGVQILSKLVECQVG